MSEFSNELERIHFLLHSMQTIIVTPKFLYSDDICILSSTEVEVNTTVSQQNKQTFIYSIHIIVLLFGK